MSFCSTCLCFFRHRSKNKRGRGTLLYRSGTCWRDGTKTHEDLSCGFHSDIVKDSPSVHIAPDKRKSP